MELDQRAPLGRHPEALEFIRFCRSRQRVSWPEIYDVMWAVATRGLFRGYGFDDLQARGIGFGLAEMPNLAALAREVIDEEPAPPRRGASAARRGLAVVGGSAVAGGS
jgi:hypothetical protein